MPTGKKRMKIAGSEKKALASAKVIGAVDPGEHIEITVMLRARSEVRGPKGRRAAVSAALNATAESPGARQYLSREEFAAQHGADPKDLAVVEAFAHDHGLTVVEASIPKRSIRLAGTIAALTAAFRPSLKTSQAEGRVFRSRTGALSVPGELADIVVGVFGFDNRPTARPHLRFLEAPEATTQGASVSVAKKAGGQKAAAPRNAADGSFKPTEVARLYNFPAGLDGTGQCIAIIELNDFDQRGRITGTGFSAKDLAAYFKSIGVKAPTVVAVGVDGGANVPGPDKNADGEVMLDIEVAGAVAPGATIAVYFAPNTDQGFLDAVNAALHDAVRKPSVISISWGSPEDANTPQSLTAFDRILQDAAMLGVTVCCSSGDDGSSDIRDPRRRDKQPHVDFPASSPFALGCGGTKLLGSGAAISSEVVWKSNGGGTGGGVSNVFSRPAYQASARVPLSPTKTVGRGVPDVAGDADPATGYQVRLVGGKKAVIGGTSAVSPLWAGLVALLNQRLAKLGKPPVGFLNPVIYSLPATAASFRDIVQGDNDIEGLKKYQAGVGWDPCTGLGSPDGARLLKALGG